MLICLFAHPATAVLQSPCPAAFTFFLFLAPCNQASANLLPAAVTSLNIEQDLLFNLFSHLEFLKITRRHANNKTCEWEAGMHIKTPAEKCLMCKFTWHFFLLNY